MFLHVQSSRCHNPILKECEDDTHIPKMRTWESFETPENSELDCKGQNTSPWSVLYTVEKVLKSRCRKWLRMSHSDICSTSYRWKKGRESNWQFDSRPLKVENWPNPGAFRWSATRHWKALEKTYKFTLEFILIEGLSKELSTPKVPGVQTETISGLLLGSHETKNHLDVGVAERHKEYYMGEGDGFSQVRPVMSLLNPELPVACPNTKGALENELTNLLVSLMQVRVSK
jgi:hypothetical protein